jgi:type II secretory pathway pseudopilin PulG
MKRRQGFTLVELLVSMALIIFIMAILSTAFVAATNTFRSLKSSGDMAEKLRATTQVLQRDLAHDHFEGKKRLSNPNFWVNGPPEQGFFQIYQGSAPSTTLGSAYFMEYTDIGGFWSYRSVDHSLAFSVKLRGNDMSNFLSAGGGMAALSGMFGPPEGRYQTNTAYNYQWAEVAWFLRPQTDPLTGAQDTAVDQAGTLTPIPLFTLYRRARLAVPDNGLVNTTPPTNPAPGVPINQAANFLEISCWPNPSTGTLYFNNAIDLTVPTRRFGGSMTPPPVGGVYPSPLTYPTLSQQLQPPQPPQPALNGSDIQLTDVISFDVQLLIPGATSATPNEPFVSLFRLPSFNGGPYNYSSPLPAGASGLVFDTWSSLNDGLSNYSMWNLPSQPGLPNSNPTPWTSIPMWDGSSGPVIQAIQISIRIWDAKTNQTRQVTMVQAM